MMAMRNAAVSAAPTDAWAVRATAAGNPRGSALVSWRLSARETLPAGAIQFADLGPDFQLREVEHIGRLHDPDRFGAWVENACLAHAWNAGQQLAYWRERLSGEPHTRLREFCSPHHQDTALSPSITEVAAYPGSPWASTAPRYRAPAEVRV